mgnify:CR=1 FL=1
MFKKLKLLLVVSLVALLVANVNAQQIKDTDVPSQVMAKFNLLYPQPKNIKWVKDKDNFEVTFTLNDVKKSLLINAGGILTEGELEFSFDQLPKNTLTYIETNLKDQRIRNYSKTTKNGVTTYKVQAEKVVYYFDETGNYIKKGDIK